MNAVEIAERIMTTSSHREIMADIGLAHTVEDLAAVMAELQERGEDRQSVWTRLHSRHTAMVNAAERAKAQQETGIVGERQIRLLESMRHGVDLYCNELQAMANELWGRYPLFVRKVAAFDTSARFRHAWLLTDEGCHWLDEIQAARGIRRVREEEVSHG